MVFPNREYRLVSSGLWKINVNDAPREISFQLELPRSSLVPFSILQVKARIHEITRVDKMQRVIIFFLAY